ncbi:MAG TPA: aminoglycoside phosphotransferase family protein, partial [Candidatus Binatia bacterium]|nr:aminoglycoside phosphotransferase family protein [Candidatus Binatia bacterium]
RRGSDGATFRIVLADGRVVKARRLSRADRAARFTSVVRRLAHPRLPVVLAVVGRISVEEWVDGTPLASLPLSADRLAQAADVLGGVHATVALDGRRLHVRTSTKRAHRIAEEQLATLVAEGRLGRADARRLVDALDRFAPPQALRGLTHNDLCAANLVEHPDGRLYVVDNEGLRHGFLDYDLARTWYRWRMPAAAWSTFVARYARWRDPSDGLPHAPFWRIAAVAKSAHLRIARESTQATVPLRRLAALASDLGRAG